MRKPFGVKVVGAQTSADRILLGHHAEGRPDLCQSLRQVSKVQQYHQIVVQRVDPIDNPMVVCSVGIRHHGAIPHCGATAEVPDSGHRLLYKMGGS